MSVDVKFCGLTRSEDVARAAELGARYVGFVHFAKSPRHIEIEDIAGLAAKLPPAVQSVALLVDPDDALLSALPSEIDWVQLHGRETPARVADIHARFGKPVMKALGVASSEDVAGIDAYEAVADQLLIDAKPPKDGTLPGGNGLSFDWSLIACRDWARPWMLAGGLDAANVARAASLTGATQVDVSSGIESAPGIKDQTRMAAFMQALA
ncbi:MAG: phosphoribosylanthranilate isomerase [Pseudomonadota bacterium]